MSTTPPDIGAMCVPSTKITDVKIVAGTSMISAIAGAGGFVLAIIGLTGLYTDHMLTIATICIGAALLFFGGAIAARYSRLVMQRSVFSEADRSRIRQRLRDGWNRCRSLRW